jgi:hypothetical protein
MSSQPPTATAIFNPRFASSAALHSDAIETVWVGLRWQLKGTRSSVESIMNQPIIESLYASTPQTALIGNIQGTYEIMFGYGDKTLSITR